tara:strand:- start:20557 stop:21510 length:954 start_codon:yes stop_codon:yes gene_type:complete
MKTLCLTPVDHIPGVVGKLKQKAQAFNYPDADMDKAKFLISELEPTALFVNPNKQTYKLDRALLEGSSVKVIATASTGTDHIDKAFCKEAGIEIISLTTDYQTIKHISSTAELAFGLTLSIVRNINDAAESVRDGRWDYKPYVGRQMNRLTVGVIGYGRLGSMYADYCNAFGSRVLICDPFVPAPSRYEQVEIEEIFEECDIVAIHVHHDEATHNMIDESLFCRSDGCYLINTSRGGIVDEEDVVQSLKMGYLKGYATDVLANEQGDIAGSPILAAMHGGANILVTPHIGGMSIEAQEMAYGRIADKLNQWFDRNPS